MNYICQVGFLSDVETKINTRIYFLKNCFFVFIFKGIVETNFEVISAYIVGIIFRTNNKSWILINVRTQISFLVSRSCYWKNK